MKSVAVTSSTGCLSKNSGSNTSLVKRDIEIYKQFSAGVNKSINRLKNYRDQILKSKPEYKERMNEDVVQVNRLADLTRPKKPETARAIPKIDSKAKSKSPFLDRVKKVEIAKHETSRTPVKIKKVVKSIPLSSNQKFRNSNTSPMVKKLRENSTSKVVENEKKEEKVIKLEPVKQLDFVSWPGVEVKKILEFSKPGLDDDHEEKTNQDSYFVYKNLFGEENKFYFGVW